MKIGSSDIRVSTVAFIRVRPLHRICKMNLQYESFLSICLPALPHFYFQNYLTDFHEILILGDYTAIWGGNLIFVCVVLL
jgi:hypothetical protein